VVRFQCHSSCLMALASPVLRSSQPACVDKDHIGTDALAPDTTNVGMRPTYHSLFVCVEQR